MTFWTFAFAHEGNFESSSGTPPLRNLLLGKTKQRTQEHLASALAFHNRSAHIQETAFHSGVLLRTKTLCARFLSFLYSRQATWQVFLMWLIGVFTHCVDSLVHGWPCVSEFLDVHSLCGWLGSWMAICVLALGCVLWMLSALSLVLSRAMWALHEPFTLVMGTLWLYARKVWSLRFGGLGVQVAFPCMVMTSSHCLITGLCTLLSWWDSLGSCTPQGWDWSKPCGVSVSVTGCPYLGVLLRLHRTSQCAPPLTEAWGLQLGDPGSAHTFCLLYTQNSWMVFESQEARDRQYTHKLVLHKRAWTPQTLGPLLY